MGGPAALLRQGAQELELGFSGDFSYADRTQPEPKAEDHEATYRLALGQDQVGFASIRRESLSLDGELVFARKYDTAEYRSAHGQNRTVRGFDPLRPLLSQLDPYPLPDRMQAGLLMATHALKGIAVHLPFEVLPAWAARGRHAVPQRSGRL
jgi:hypothetical protein